MSLSDDMHWMLAYVDKHEGRVWRRHDHDEPDSFHYLLLHLFLKADARNYHRLKGAYPEVAKAIEHWRATDGEILEDVDYG